MRDHSISAIGNLEIIERAVRQAHSGQTAGSGSDANANTNVPEPTTLVLLMFATAGWCNLLLIVFTPTCKKPVRGNSFAKLVQSCVPHGRSKSRTPMLERTYDQLFRYD